MGKSSSKTKKALLKLIKSAFSEWSRCEVVDVDDAFQLPDKKVKVKLKDYPFELHLYPDGKSLQIYPEKSLINSHKTTGTETDHYILFDPDNYFSEISGFYRLDDGDKITLGGAGNSECAFLNISKDTPLRKLTIRNDEGLLLFKSHMSKPQSCVSPLYKDKKMHRLLNWRHKKLHQVREILAGAIENLPNEDALALIQDVNKIMEKEAHRPLDNSGQPGGVVVIPESLPVIIVGDLHAKPDNLLVILTQNGFLEALIEQRASLVFLGDAVHPEGEAPLDEMENSILIMDIIFKLKLRFPEQVFYIRGNHDSFSEDISKGGIPQGLLWKKALIKTRGKKYKNEMSRFYELLPYLAYSEKFVACHAAPPTSSVSLKELINVRTNAKLIKQLISNRIKQSNRLAGYTRSDVKRLRKNLGLSQKSPMIVGHTPMSSDDTIWENVGNIENHTIVYSSDTEWVGLMAEINDKLWPLRYPTENLMSLISETSGK